MTDLDQVLDAEVADKLNANDTTVTTVSNPDWHNQVTPKVHGAPADDVDNLAQLAASRIEWADFWAKDHAAADFLCDPFLARGRAHALYAPAKAGKSYFACYTGAAIASGRPVLNRPGGTPEGVVYVDLEMTEQDVAERLGDFGYDATADLSRFHYLVLPDLPPLDTAAGGEALTSYATSVGATVVIIDTLGRSIVGPENDADTLRAFARHTGSRLKAAGMTWLRTDHAGKEVSKGARGSSAKADDVDVVWKLTRLDGKRVQLDATHRRIGWVPEKVTLTLDEGPPSEYRLVSGGWPKGTAEAAADLDVLEVPIDASERAARATVKVNGLKMSNEVLRAALRYRRRAGA